jgi:hypothetical protein
MSLARAIATLVGLLALDTIAAFVLLVVAGLVAPKGTGTGLTVVLGALLLSIFVAFAASAAVYIRMLSSAHVGDAGRWVLGGSFLLALVLLYLASVLVTLVAFNR